MENEETNVPTEETIPNEEHNEPDTEAEDTEIKETETEEKADTTGAEDTVTDESTDKEVDAPYLSVKYNHSDREMTKEEAVNYAQKGLMYEKVNPVINQLDYIAAQNNMSVTELVDKMLKDSDEAYKQSLVDKYGDDEQLLSDMLELHHNKQKAKYDKVVADRQKAEETTAAEKQASTESRLADEFIKLKAEFPDLKEFKDLPKSVKKSAADGKDLMTAYLLFKHNENKKILAAKETQKKAAKSSTGPQSDKPIDENNSLNNEFIKGIWS